MSRKLATFLLVLTALAALLITSVVAQDTAKKEEKAKFEYVGEAKCKLCHKDVHTSWLATKHAKAYDVLSDEEKKKPECVKCHITGTTAAGELLEGVQCEACHGPGSEYKSATIMNKKKWEADPAGQLKLAQEKGLIVPKAEDCVRCHTKEGHPNFKEFNFEKMHSLVHPVAAKEAGKE